MLQEFLTADRENAISVSASQQAKARRGVRNLFGEGCVFTIDLPRDFTA